MPPVYRPLLSSLAVASLLACTATGPANPTPGTTTGDSSAPSTQELAAAEPKAPAPAPVYGALRAEVAPDVSVTALTVTPKPQAGGPTMADVDADTDPNDDSEPKVPVLFAAPGYPAATTPTNGQISQRGNTTRRLQAKSYKIELNAGTPDWRDANEVLLNKHGFDTSRMRNKLFFDLARMLPEFVLPQTWFTTMRLGTADYGLFTQIEKVGKSLLKHAKLDSSGYLYKAKVFEFGLNPDLKLTTDPGYNEKAFESHLEIKGKKDHAPLLAMLKAVNDPTVPINTTIDKYFDRANFITWFATNVVVDNLDTDAQNFYLYHPSGEGKWQFIPWDYDITFGYYEQEGKPDRATWISRTGSGPSNWWGSTLERRFLKDPENLRQLQARIDDLVNTVFSAARIKAHTDAYRAAIRPVLTQAPDKDQLAFTGAAWEAIIDKLPNAPAEARSRFLDGMKRPMPVFVNAEKKGEEWLFTWDKSYDLQGDSLTYELIVARDPALTDVVVQKAGLTTTSQSVPLTPGTYYWTVKIHDATGEWQIPFGVWNDPANPDKNYFGVSRLDV